MKEFERIGKDLEGLGRNLKSLERLERKMKGKVHNVLRDHERSEGESRDNERSEGSRGIMKGQEG